MFLFGEFLVVGGCYCVVIIGSGFGGLNVVKVFKWVDVDIMLIFKIMIYLF